MVADRAFLKAQIGKVNLQLCLGGGRAGETQGGEFFKSRMK